MQIAAFADYQPGSGGGQAAAGKPEQADEDTAEQETAGGGLEDGAPSGGGDGGSSGGGGGGGGDYPAHSVMGLPALSPTMASGEKLSGVCGILDPDTACVRASVALVVCIVPDVKVAGPSTNRRSGRRSVKQQACPVAYCDIL